jgi:hypothetical protein
MYIKYNHISMKVPMNKTLHFLSGLPRSGSTVLAAILNQNPKTRVSATSGLVHALTGLAETWHKEPMLKDNDPEMKKLAKTMAGTIDAFYSDFSQPIVIDKNRAWPTPMIMSAMEQVLGRPMKIIATVRSVPDCMASFVRIVKPKDLDDFIYNDFLVKHLQGSYMNLAEGYAYRPDWFLFVEYNDLLKNPKQELERIHEFLGLKPFEYNFNKIDGSSVKEDDELLHHVAGLHNIKPKLKAQHKEHARDQLKYHHDSFVQPEFWNPKFPTSVKPIHDLDLQLAASMHGDYKEGLRLAKKLKKEEPWNHRAAFNRGWYELHEGHIQEGYRLMDRGRIVGVFGNDKPGSPQPAWDGKAKGTILLQLEGGLGDQLHQIRYAKIIADRGNQVLVSCAAPLVQFINNMPGVSASIQHGGEGAVYHSHYVQGMSSIVPLKLELNDISGKPYIKLPVVKKGKRLRIGLRWSGNKSFEDQHKKLFPHELMFNAVKGFDAEFISLQRDDGAEHCPSWVKQVPLNTWKETQQAIASCNLVISSCTSVSHLAAAMGVETWVVVPLMAYFLYALPGEQVPYYDSMRLFRQEEFGSWVEPFEKIQKELPLWSKQRKK